jgi:replication factor A1
MDLDEILEKIAKESGLEEGEIRERVEKKQAELGGLITPEGAAHIVANEAGVNLLEGIVRSTEVKIENIIPGMSSIDLTGKVLRIFPPRTFEKKDGSQGKIASLILGDETGTIRVVFWGADVQKLEEGEIEEGGILRIRGGYSKENLNGEAEVHIGMRTKLVLNLKDVEIGEIPAPEARTLKVSEMEGGLPSVDLLCKVLRIHDVREFEREDKTRGRVVNLVVGDETGTCRLVLWDDDVGLVEGGQIREGATIKVRKGYVKERFGELEVNVGRYGKIVLNPPEGEIEEVREDSSSSLKRKEIRELRIGERAEIRGALVEVYDKVTLFERKEGKGIVVNGVIDDGTGNLRAAFYDRTAEVLLNLPLQKILEEGVSEDVLAARREELLGREIVAVVGVRRSDFSGKNELVVHDLDLHPDPKAIAKALLKATKAYPERKEAE